MNNRRNFLKLSATLSTGLVAIPFQKTSFANDLMPGSALLTQAIGQKRSLRIGAPTYFSERDPDAWARNAREQQYRAVNAPNVSINDTERIKAFREAAERYDLVIAQVGRWINLMDADPEKRKENIDSVTEGLALADELNAKCCINIAGSYNTEFWDGPHPKNVTNEFFDIAVENARKIIDAVKPKRAVFTYEMMGHIIPDTPANCLRLIHAIDRKGYGVNLDICNMINSPDTFWNNTRLINETVDMLGPWIVTVHAKDLRWQRGMSLHFVECVIGEGEFDHGTLLNRLATLPQDVPVIIEHMNNKEEYLKCRDHLFQVAAEIGVSVS